MARRMSQSNALFGVSYDDDDADVPATTGWCKRDGSKKTDHRALDQRAIVVVASRRAYRRSLACSSSSSA